MKKCLINPQKGRKMGKCKHKRTMLAIANYVDFRPDQEPFESGRIECAGVSKITIESIYIHYCPKCKKVIDIEIEPNCEISTEPCASGNRCDGRH
jgi:hypothetical protein